MSTFSLSRKIARHKTMFKVDENIPTHAQNIFPDKCCTIPYYTMGNPIDYCLPKYGLKWYKSSLGPTVIC